MASIRVNVGKLVQGRAHLMPCTPSGVIEMLERSEIRIAGTHAVVIGRSEIVGKPMAMLLLQRDATVTICHSKTPDLPAVARTADILVAAIGRPGFVMPAFVKPGATVIDVGISPVTDPAIAARLFDPESPRLADFVRRGSLVVGDVHGSVGGSRRGAHPGAWRCRASDDRDAVEEHRRRCAGSPSGVSRCCESR